MKKHQTIIPQYPLKKNLLKNTLKTSLHDFFRYFNVRKTQRNYLSIFQPENKLKNIFSLPSPWHKTLKFFETSK